MPRLRLLHNPKLDAVTLLPALLFVLVLSVFLRVLVRASFVRLIQTRQVLLSWVWGTATHLFSLSTKMASLKYALDCCWMGPKNGSLLIINIDMFLLLLISCLCFFNSAYRLLWFLYIIQLAPIVAVFSLKLLWLFLYVYATAKWCIHLFLAFTMRSIWFFYFALFIVFTFFEIFLSSVILNWGISVKQTRTEWNSIN